MSNLCFGTLYDFMSVALVFPLLTIQNFLSTARNHIFIDDVGQNIDIYLLWPPRFGSKTELNVK